MSAKVNSTTPRASRRRSNRPPFEAFIRRLLPRQGKKVSVRISQNSISLLSSLVEDMLARVSHRSAQLTVHRNKVLVQNKDFMDAILLTMPTNIGSALVTELLRTED